jgi:tetratricopeptide (TPR) repeat protein
MEGRYDDAVVHGDRVIVLLEGTEDSLQRARAELLCAEILLWDGSDERAAEHAARCGALVGAANNDDLGALRATEALLAMRRGDPTEAEALALAALHLLGESGFGRYFACLALALVHLEAGALEDGIHAYESGLAALERAHMRQQAASYCREWAEALEAAGELREAEAVRATAASFAVRERAATS